MILVDRFMKKRRIITIDECMSMTEQEFLSFVEEDEKMLCEGIGDINESNIDFQGMSILDVAQKYGCIPMDEVFTDIRRKLNGK